MAIRERPRSLPSAGWTLQWTLASHGNIPGGQHKLHLWALYLLLVSFTLAKLCLFFIDKMGLTVLVLSITHERYFVDSPHEVSPADWPVSTRCGNQPRDPPLPLSWVTGHQHSLMSAAKRITHQSKCLKEERGKTKQFIYNMTIIKSRTSENNKNNHSNKNNGECSKQ